MIVAGSLPASDSLFEVTLADALLEIDVHVAIDCRPAGDSLIEATLADGDRSGIANLDSSVG